jgi:hypothetical protein
MSVETRHKFSWWPTNTTPPHTHFMDAASIEWWVGVVGIDLSVHGGLYTNVNTLILRPNCRDVVTSFSGTPEYFKDDDIRVGGASQIWSRNP